MSSLRVITFLFVMGVAVVCSGTERLIAIQHIERCYGEAFYAQDYQLAMEHINALTLIMPNNVEYLREKAKILLVLGRHAEGAAIISKIAQVGGEPSNKAIWEIYYWQLITETDRETLKGLLTENARVMAVLAIEPYVREGESYKVFGGYEASVLAKYGRMSFVETKTIHTQNLVEKQASLSSLFSTSIDAISAAPDLAPNNLIEAYNVAYYAGNYQQALQIVDRLLLDQPKNLDYLREKAKMLIGIGNLAQAAETLKAFPRDSQESALAMVAVCDWERTPSYFRSSIKIPFYEKNNIKQADYKVAGVKSDNTQAGLLDELGQWFEKIDRESQQRKLALEAQKRSYEIQRLSQETIRRQQDATWQANLNAQSFASRRDHDNAMTKLNKEYKSTLKAINNYKKDIKKNNDSSDTGDKIWVNPYYRKDGTYVSGYFRSK